MSRLMRVLGILGLVLVLGCAGYRDGEKRTVGQFADDAAIQTKVKLSLVRDRDIKGWPINVDVRKGVVSLHGRVADEALRERAIAKASAVKGVVRVDDRLTIVTE